MRCVGFMSSKALAKLPCLAYTRVSTLLKFRIAAAICRTRCQYRQWGEGRAEYILLAVGTIALDVVVLLLNSNRTSSVPLAACARDVLHCFDVTTAKVAGIPACAHIDVRSLVQLVVASCGN